MVSIRFVAKGLRQLRFGFVGPMAWLGFYSLCREGSSSTTADEIVLIVDEMFLFALSRRVFVNSSAESLASPLRFLFALSRRVFVNGATVSTAGCVLVSIRFVAKGLRQLLVPAPEGVETTMFLFALSRRVFVNRSSLDGRLTSPVGATIHTRLRGRICRYRVPVKSKHRGLSASCTPDLGSLVSRTPRQGSQVRAASPPTTPLTGRPRGQYPCPCHERSPCRSRRPAGRGWTPPPPPEVLQPDRPNGRQPPGADDH